MAKSKHRKKQVAENRKHLDKAKKKHKALNTSVNRSRRKSQEIDKENVDQVGYKCRGDRSPIPVKGASGKADEMQLATYEESGWLTGIYSWCQTGISNVVTQVCMLAAQCLEVIVAQTTLYYPV